MKNGVFENDTKNAITKRLFSKLTIEEERQIAKFIKPVTSHSKKDPSNYPRDAKRAELDVLTINNEV